MTISTRMGQSGLKNTDPAIPVVSAATQDSAVNAAEADQTAPVELSLAEEMAFSQYLDTLPPDEALKQLVAHIQTLGTRPYVYTASPADREAALAHLRKEVPPLTAEEMEERDREWRAVEEEIRALS
ncbi:MAG TPA: hypothetical protein VN207_13835 [Ktedonobacteraceae bacterium]|nr:hypothetical protein [Ktedonobacteraceae bacterium]